MIHVFTLVLAATVIATPAGTRYSVSATPRQSAAQQMAAARRAYSDALRDYAPNTDGRHRGVATALANLELLIRNFNTDRSAVGDAFLLEAEIFDHECAYKNVIDISDRATTVVAHTTREPLMMWHKANALSHVNRPDDADIAYSAAEQGQFAALDSFSRLAILNSAAHFHSLRKNHVRASDELRQAAAIAPRPFIKLNYMLRSVEENVAGGEADRARADVAIADDLVARASSESLSASERAELDDHARSLRSHRTRLHM